MKRACLLSRVVAIVVAIASFAAPAAASHPDMLQSFHLIPRESTLQQTGGIAGIDIQYTLFGEFDLVSGYRDGVVCMAIGCPPPDHVPYAQFENVRVFAVNDRPDVDVFDGIPLDYFVDLKSLEGTFRTFYPNEPDPLFSRRYHFIGEDIQGQTFALDAVQRGRLLHMVGQSREMCCDFFQYKLDALARIAPYADFNLDGVVDHVDSDQLLANIGTFEGASFDQGDADGDADVDGDDFLIWQQQIGYAVNVAELTAETYGAAAGSTLGATGSGLAGVTGSASAAIPEPATFMLILIAAASAARARRPRHLQTATCA